ncbi:MAG: DNA translocase FtsK 4TM domain-containing protein [Vicinamibacterales bacterium]
MPVSDSLLSRRFNELLGVVLFGLTLIWLVALASYSAADPVWFFNSGGDAAPGNFAGRVGAFTAEASFQLLGYGAYLMPAILAIVGWHYFWCRELEAEYTKAVGALLLVAAVSTLLALALGNLTVDGKTFRAGGYIGQLAADGLSEYLNRTGSTIVVLTMLILAVGLGTQFSIGRAFSLAGQTARGQATGLLGRLAEWREERRKEKQRQDVIRKHTEKAGADAAKAAEVARAATMAASLKAARKPDPPARPARDDEDDDVDDVAPATAKGAKAPAIRRMAATEPSLLPDPEPKAPAERRKGAYTLPPLSLLDPARSERKVDERELMDAARLLEEKCREFSVEGSVVQIHPGPVVTTYEFKPDAGVKYSKITGLMDDLCLAMKAESVLIDRIPGKSTVGIQIPNANREAISLRELLESDIYRRSASRLTLALGKTIHGEGFISDLATMPHLLIAGSTGAGKSVSVNAMISSVLFRATPEEVRFIMVDPKRLELGMYEGIPHLLTPVVVDPKLAANALRWAVHEMEERYKTLAAFGVRNIEQYNRNIKAMLAESKTGQDEHGRDLVPLPFIVVIIDELADLMMVAGNEVEESICRLAQMARAVGIHLILATQRPSVDVITGLIKANLPARISFRVSSRIDSRTILDSGGAEQLLGKGDMLYLPPASSRFVRVHGPYISEQESARLASFLRKQGKPQYDPTITAEDKTAAGGGGTEFEKDDLYDEASRIIVSSGQASISYLQRRLRIGFSRAARLVDMMEADGLVSPPNSSAGGKREVLVKKEYFEEVDAQLR